jgi:hypothetical protein
MQSAHNLNRVWLRAGENQKWHLNEHTRIGSDIRPRHSGMGKLLQHFDARAKPIHQAVGGVWILHANMLPDVHQISACQRRKF